MHFFGHCQLLCYSTANVVESSYGLDNLEVTNHANSSMENDVMMLMQLATCKLCFCFCQFSFIYLVNKTCKRKTKYVGIIRRRILLVCHLPFFDRQSDIWESLIINGWLTISLSVSLIHSYHEFRSSSNINLGP